jgi:hypothetical protein
VRNRRGLAGGRATRTTITLGLQARSRTRRADPKALEKGAFQ